MFYDDEPMDDMGGGTATPATGDDEDGDKDGMAGGETGGDAAM